MTETLPNQQPEKKSWNNRLELHKNAARLNAAEITSVLGSMLLQSRTDFDEMFEADTISDHQHIDETRKINGALEELAGLEVLGEGSQSDFNQDLQLLAQSLKREQESLPFGTMKHQELASRRVSVAYLIDQFEFEIKTPQDELEKETKPSEIREVIKKWTNQIIETHNNRAEVSNPESISDNPEMKEAQARVHARYAEQARRQEPTESVDDARQKVAEVFGDTKEAERALLLHEVAQAAVGTTRIHTDIPSGAKLKSSTGEYYPIDGFNTFGDGIAPESGHHFPRLRYEDSAEAFIIEPATTTKYKTVTKSVEVGGRFRKKTEQFEEQVSDGEVPTMVTNPITGQQELGIKVGYQFNGNTRGRYGHAVQYEGPAYITESGRAGNQLFVEATLPKSLADKLIDEVSKNPEAAREFAKKLAVNNGITEQAWNNGVRPPYDQLPSDWQLTLSQS